MRKALIVGTFNPFTVGHDNIVRRTLALFDEVVIGIGVNESKETKTSIDERATKIRELYKDFTNIEVKTYSDLTVDFAQREQVCCIVKGVRSVKDFEYERDQAEINKKLSGIETLLLPADPQFSAISSTLVRELQAFGRDVTEFLP